MIHNMVDVTLARETATFSVPVSEAMMPESLRNALAKARQETALQTTEENFGGGADANAVIESDEVIDDEVIEPVEKDDLTARELAFLSRMAPPAAE